MSAGEKPGDATAQVDERAVEAPSPSLKDTLLAAPLEGVFLEREQGERRETELPQAGVPRHPAQAPPPHGTV